VRGNTCCALSCWMLVFYLKGELNFFGIYFKWWWRIFLFYCLPRVLHSPLILPYCPSIWLIACLMLTDTPNIVITKFYYVRKYYYYSYQFIIFKTFDLFNKIKIHYIRYIELEFCYKFVIDFIFNEFCL
jgi:hypothetical protein